MFEPFKAGKHQGVWSLFSMQDLPDETWLLIMKDRPEIWGRMMMVSKRFFKLSSESVTSVDVHINRSLEKRCFRKWLKRYTGQLKEVNICACSDTCACCGGDSIYKNQKRILNSLFSALLSVSSLQLARLHFGNQLPGDLQCLLPHLCGKAPLQHLTVQAVPPNTLVQLAQTATMIVDLTLWRVDNLVTDHLTQFGLLTSLALCNCWLVGKVALGDLVHLQHLNVEGSCVSMSAAPTYRPYNWTANGDGTISFSLQHDMLATATSLTFLKCSMDLARVPPSVSTHGHLASLTRLQRLQLSGQTSAAVLGQLTHLGALTHLAFLDRGQSHNSLQAAAIGFFEAFTNLQHLDVALPHLSTPGSLSLLTQLTFLRFTQHKLQTVRFLSCLKNLRHLHMMPCSDSGTSGFNSWDAYDIVQHYSKLTWLDFGRPSKYRPYPSQVAAPLSPGQTYHITAPGYSPEDSPGYSPGYVPRDIDGSWSSDNDDDVKLSQLRRILTPNSWKERLLEYSPGSPGYRSSSLPSYHPSYRNPTSPPYSSCRSPVYWPTSPSGYAPTLAWLSHPHCTTSEGAPVEEAGPHVCQYRWFERCSTDETCESSFHYSYDAAGDDQDHHDSGGHRTCVIVRQSYVAHYEDPAAVATLQKPMGDTCAVEKMSPMAGATKGLWPGMMHLVMGVDVLAEHKHLAAAFASGAGAMEQLNGMELYSSFHANGIGFIGLSAFTSCEVLDLSGCIALCPGAFQHMTRLNRLTKLLLNSARLGDEDSFEPHNSYCNRRHGCTCAECCKFATFDVAVFGPSPDRTALQAATIQGLSNLVSLRHLEMEGCDVSAAAGLSVLVNLTCLKAGNNYFDTESLRALSALTQLKHLVVGYAMTDTDDQGRTAISSAVKALDHLTCLTHLGLWQGKLFGHCD